MKKRFLVIWCFLLVNTCWSQSIFENFDNYKVGQSLGQQSNGLWTTWNNDPGLEDTYISNEHSYSSNNSIKLVSGDSTDVVLPLGDKTAGNWSLSFMMRINEGHGAYFNLLHEFAAAESNWAVQVHFFQTGFGYLTVGSGVVNSNFNHPVGSWFEVNVDVDIDNDEARLTINESFILSWIWSEGSMNGAEATPNSTLAALNFYPSILDNESDSYYVDDVSFSEYGVGLSELENEVSVYPNPATNNFSLKDLKNADIQVFNLLGGEVLNLRSSNYEAFVDCSTWKRGVYFLKIIQEDGAVKQSKIIVE